MALLINIRLFWFCYRPLTKGLHIHLWYIDHTHHVHSRLSWRLLIISPSGITYPYAPSSLYCIPIITSTMHQWYLWALARVHKLQILLCCQWHYWQRQLRFPSRSLSTYVFEYIKTRWDRFLSFSCRYLSNCSNASPYALRQSSIVLSHLKTYSLIYSTWHYLRFYSTKIL